MIIHFMQMKMQWDTMSEDEKTQKKTEMKQMFQDYLDLILESSQIVVSLLENFHFQNFLLQDLKVNPSSDFLSCYE